MKKTIFLLSMLCMICCSPWAQSAKYPMAMKASLEKLESAKTPEDLLAVSATFERIAEAEKSEWLPYYYAALSQARLGFVDPSLDKDKVGEKVKDLTQKAAAIENNGELCALRNMAATLQLLVDPKGRWATYGKQAGEALEAGFKLDPQNPRLYYLKGMALFNQPAFIGGGKDKAKPYFEKALAFFATQSTDPLYPKWGLKETELYLEKCK
ncbi:MAG TPA: hypothetical protein VL053_20560 [Arachidicoccus sp.]|nr:hypothetical protein [Arachidicoccus sp.]